MADPTGNPLFDLIQEKGTLVEVEHFLRERGLTHSASSWDQMWNERIRPALQDPDVQLEDAELLRLLGELEEHGHQHVFLYECVDDRARAFLAEDEVERYLREMDAEKVLEAPRLLELPPRPTIAEARREASPFDGSVVLKVIETRIYHERVGRRDVDENVYDIRYRDVPTRSVNLFRLHGSGLLELRLESHRNASRDYSAERERMWGLVEPWFPRTAFSPLSLSHAKYAIWEQRDALRDIVGFSDSEFRDTEGSKVRAASGGRAYDLADDTAVSRSLDEFNKADTHCDRANVWWREQVDGPPSKDLRTLLAGELNEFSISAGCNREDYEYALLNILRFNQRT